MTSTKAKVTIKGKHYEIIIDLEEALKIKKGAGGDIAKAILVDTIFHNSKSGEKAGQSDLVEAFGTADLNVIAEKIIKKGNIELPQEHRDAEREAKVKQIIDWYVVNSVDAKTGRPFTFGTIESALKQSGVNIDKKPAEQQIPLITPEISKVLAIKIETKKLIITIPAVYTGKIYGIINEYKEKEDWLGNGDLKVVVNIPTGLQSEFYDKLNSVTHGTAITQEEK